MDLVAQLIVDSLEVGIRAGRACTTMRRSSHAGLPRKSAIEAVSPSRVKYSPGSEADCPPSSSPLHALTAMSAMQKQTPANVANRNRAATTTNVRAVPPLRQAGARLPLPRPVWRCVPAMLVRAVLVRPVLVRPVTPTRCG